VEELEGRGARHLLPYFHDKYIQLKKIKEEERRRKKEMKAGGTLRESHHEA